MQAPQLSAAPKRLYTLQKVDKITWVWFSLSHKQL